MKQTITIPVRAEIGGLRSEGYRHRLRVAAVALRFIAWLIKTDLHVNLTVGK